MVRRLTCGSFGGGNGDTLHPSMPSPSARHTMILRIRCICVIPPIVHTGKKLVNNLIDITGATSQLTLIRLPFLLETVVRLC